MARARLHMVRTPNLITYASVCRDEPWEGTMRIEMLGHACLLCETEDTRILMDPWILGPANFRSWWHFPAVTRDPAELPPLDYIYVSHLHEDHFHGATLAQLDR